MAEAVVEGNPMSRFFCHKCSVEIEILLPDYTCPYCTSGFIEQLGGGGSEDMEDDSNSDSRPYLHSSSIEISGDDLSDLHIDLVQTPTVGMLLDVMGPLRQIAELSSNGSDASQGTRGVQGQQDNLDRRNRTTHVLVEDLVENFVRNLSGFGLHLPTAQGGPVQPFLFLGNPGDYVWGRDGLDTIVTQLLNQMDGSGPPPLPRKEIDEIPIATVSQNQIDIKLQCSICWEDFILAELVRQLPCKHIYHTPCIEPWLELHGTCPICRQSLGDQSSADANRDTVGPSLAALFRAANQTSNGRTPSAPSSSTSDE
ncbi:E3 ubiquitin-protein ligase Iruka isoform X2 [Venturia canescens]|uniref:E3 ubiquitin-protein ligase Iruka isoform X2 n=1 Tax=Venturia canescens TaxID=32260 RepID=UPI001C9CDB4C|nr:E3 ubiquitin-protein ligase Iruka isoform X2 [Venturia canescens]